MASVVVPFPKASMLLPAGTLLTRKLLVYVIARLASLKALICAEELPQELGHWFCNQITYSIFCYLTDLVVESAHMLLVQLRAWTKVRVLMCRSGYDHDLHNILQGSLKSLKQNCMGWVKQTAAAQNVCFKILGNLVSDCHNTEGKVDLGNYLWNLLLHLAADSKETWRGTANQDQQCQVKMEPLRSSTVQQGNICVKIRLGLRWSLAKTKKKANSGNESGSVERIQHRCSMLMPTFGTPNESKVKLA